MNILIDKKTPFGKEAFRHLGNVTAVASQEISNEAVRDKDILVVRSETPVNRGLLEGSRVRFVGTTTIGTDHIDLGYLSSQKIGFASAPGCNANSVMEYVVIALLTLAVRNGSSLKGKTLGVVGVGNIGSKMVVAGRALGMNVLENDPPLERLTGDSRFISLDEIMEADFVTLHVPLTRQGEDATYHLFDERRIAQLRKSAFLINTSRGSVVKTSALIACLQERRMAGAVLDVWENEPNIDMALLSLTELATPHIAGYSFDGKVNAVQMISSAVCDYLGCADKWKVPAVQADISQQVALMPEHSGGFEKDLLSITSRCYDIEGDDVRLRELVGIPPDKRGKQFSRLRAEYPLRREFGNTRVKKDAEQRELLDTLRELGFVMEER